MYDAISCVILSLNIVSFSLSLYIYIYIYIYCVIQYILWSSLSVYILCYSKYSPESAIGQLSSLPFISFFSRLVYLVLVFCVATFLFIVFCYLYPLIYILLCWDKEWQRGYNFISTYYFYFLATTISSPIWLNGESVNKMEHSTTWVEVSHLLITLFLILEPFW